MDVRKRDISVTIKQRLLKINEKVSQMSGSNKVEQVIFERFFYVQPIFAHSSVQTQDEKG